MINFFQSISVKERTKRTYSCLLFSLFFLAACENDMNEVKKLTEKRISVEEATKIDSYLSQQGKMRARLTAPLMKRYQVDTPYAEFPKSLHVDFYDSSLNVESQLNARYGKYKENENKVFLKDSVVIFNNKGDTLHAMELWWDQNQQKFYTDKPVRIYQKDKVVYGQHGMEAGQNFDWYNINQSSGTVDASGFEL